MTAPISVGAAIELADVRKQFGAVVAVNGIDLNIRPGEFLTLLGPSGCGKTTTLRMIGGFEWPSSGSIRIAGADVSQLPPHKRPVNTVFQQYALFPHMSVAKNVGYGLRMARLPGREINERVAEALEMVRLPNVADRNPGELSGGQQQRVALARALINRPSVLLLDEPLGALDLKLRKAMQLELKQLNREVGATFVYVTHDQEEALTMSDRIAVMSRGAIWQIGSPAEIYERPASRFVADFIGQSNLLEGVVEQVVEASALIRLAGGAIVGAAIGDGIGAHEDVLVSVRPENVFVSEQPSEGGIKGRVADVVYLGAYLRLLLDVGQARLLAANVPAGSSFVSGAEVVVTFPASKAVAFRDQEAVDTM